MTCPTCKGAHRIVLFTSIEDCQDCTRFSLPAFVTQSTQTDFVDEESYHRVKICGTFEATQENIKALRKWQFPTRYYVIDSIDIGQGSFSINGREVYL